MRRTTRKLSHDESYLREQRQRLTSQRRLVLEIMGDSHGHLTVEEVLGRASKRDAAVSLASVYRILAWLTEHRLVCVTDVGGRDLVYEYLGSARHHHLICQQCGNTLQVSYELISPVLERVREEYGFEPRIDHQAIFGICQSCQQQEGA